MVTLPARVPSVEEFLCSNLNDTSCLILDVQLKGLSGLELQERLIGEGRRTQIIFVTAVLDEQIRNQVLKAGAIDILSKPFSDERLSSCLVSALSKEEAPCGGGRRGFSKWMHRLGGRLQTGHVSARLGHYRLIDVTQNDPVWSHCNTLVHLGRGIARPKSMSQNTAP